MREKSGRVLGLGTATLDFRIKTADFGPEYREKLLALETRAYGGGAMGNCLVQIARLGGKAQWLGKLGRDWIAERILEQLEGEGVDCSSVLRDQHLCSPFNLAAYAGDHLRRIGGFLIPNSLAVLSPEDIDSFTVKIRKGDWVIVEIGEIPLERVLSFCRKAKFRGASLAADVDLDPIRQCGGEPKIIGQIFQSLDILMPSHSAMMSLHGPISEEELALRMSREYEATVVVTAGERGSFYCEFGQEVRHQEALETEVVDTVGAGDAFRGGFIHGLSHNLSMAEAAEMGSRCAAINCRSFGAREGMPRLSDLP